MDTNYQPHLLEVNPGPDFKQTGSRLKRVIVSLWENTCKVILDGDKEANRQLVKVYDEEWSVGKMAGGMKLV